MKKLVAIMALSFGLIFSSYAQEKAPQMRERKMNDSCKMMVPQNKMNGEKKDFDRTFYRPPMRYGMRGFERQGLERKDFEKQDQRKMVGKMEGKMEGMKDRPMMNRPIEGRPEHPMYMRGRGMIGNMYHNFSPKPEQKVEIEKKDVKETVTPVTSPTKIKKGPGVDESTLPMDEFIKYINYKE